MTDTAGDPPPNWYGYPHYDRPFQFSAAQDYTNWSVQPALCQWCGLAHNTVCHLIKAIEYYENGTIKRVEFKDAKA